MFNLKFLDMNLAYALFITGTAIAAKALLPYQWSEELLIYILLLIVAINRFEIRKILITTNLKTKRESKALNICDVSQHRKLLIAYGKKLNEDLGFPADSSHIDEHVDDYISNL